MDHPESDAALGLKKRLVPTPRVLEPPRGIEAVSARAHEGGLDLRLAVPVLQVQRLEDVGLLDLFLRREDIVALGLKNRWHRPGGHDTGGPAHHPGATKATISITYVHTHIHLITSLVDAKLN